MKSDLRESLVDKERFQHLAWLVSHLPEFQLVSRKVPSALLTLDSQFALASPQGGSSRVESCL